MITQCVGYTQRVLLCSTRGETPILYRKKMGWAKEELYDEFGDARVRTDGGRARLKKLAPSDAGPNQ